MYPLLERLQMFVAHNDSSIYLISLLTFLQKLFCISSDINWWKLQLSQSMQLQSLSGFKLHQKPRMSSYSRCNFIEKQSRLLVQFKVLSEHLSERFYSNHYEYSNPVIIINILYCLAYLKFSRNETNVLRIYNSQIIRSQAYHTPIVTCYILSECQIFEVLRDSSCFQR